MDIITELKQKESEAILEGLAMMTYNPSNFSLDGIIFKEMYYAWQKCLRFIYPEKPVLLDVFWSLNRRT